jgi:small subunit ribosomal protein S16
MLKIRLQKIGKKNDPSYRVVLVEHTTSPHGKFIELLGSYNTKLKQRKLNKERIEYWLAKGAQASPTIHNLLVDEKIISEAKVKAWKPKKKKEEAVSAGATTTGAEKEAKTEIPPVEAPKAEQPKQESAPPTPAEGEIGVPNSETAVSGVGVDTEPKKE